MLRRGDTMPDADHIVCRGFLMKNPMDVNEKTDSSVNTLPYLRIKALGKIRVEHILLAFCKSRTTNKPTHTELEQEKCQRCS